MDIDKYIEENADRKEALRALHASSASPFWYTPKDIVSLVVDVLGEIDLDPCSNDGEPNIPAKRHYTEKEDGLKHHWMGKVFMNPPYGKTIGKWTQWLQHEYESGNVTEAIALVPVRTDTKWFSYISEHTYCFLRGRIKFVSDNGNSNSSIFPSVAIYLGKDDSKFIEVFHPKGACMRSVRI